MREAETTLVVLAGGMGTRMGRPKGLLTIHGQPILTRLIEQIGWRGATMLVTGSATTHPPGCERFDREVCDPIPGEGPLRGIATALENGVQRAIVLPVDMPAMSGDVLRWMAAQACESGLFVRRLGEMQAMPMVITGDADQMVRMRLDQGRRSVYGLASEPGFTVIDAPAEWPDEVWLNVNEPGDVERFERGVR